MQYNDIHYWVLAEVAHHLSGQPVPEFVQQHIFDPLEMRATTFNHTLAAETGNLAGTYERTGIDLAKCQEGWKARDALDRSCYGYPVETECFIEGDGIEFAGPAGIVASQADMVGHLRHPLGPIR